MKPRMIAKLLRIPREKIYEFTRALKKGSYSTNSQRLTPLTKVTKISEKHLAFLRNFVEVREGKKITLS